MILVAKTQTAITSKIYVLSLNPCKNEFVKTFFLKGIIGSKMGTKVHEGTGTSDISQH